MIEEVKDDIHGAEKVREPKNFHERVEDALRLVVNRKVKDFTRKLVKMDVFPEGTEITLKPHKLAFDFIHNSSAGEFDLTVIGDGTMVGYIQFGGRKFEIDTGYAETAMLEIVKELTRVVLERVNE